MCAVSWCTPIGHEDSSLHPTNLKVQAFHWKWITDVQVNFFRSTNVKVASPPRRAQAARCVPTDVQIQQVASIGDGIRLFPKEEITQKGKLPKMEITQKGKLPKMEIYQKWKFTKNGNYQKWKILKMEMTKNGNYQKWELPKMEITKKWTLPKMKITKYRNYQKRQIHPWVDGIRSTILSWTGTVGGIWTHNQNLGWLCLCNTNILFSGKMQKNTNKF